MTKIAYRERRTSAINSTRFEYKCPYCRKVFEAGKEVIPGDYYTCPNCRQLIKLGGWLV